MHIPGATYRLQLNFHFTLVNVLENLDYFEALGVTDLYLSPLLAARSHSMNDYDVVDHGRLNPEIGTEAELRMLAEGLQARGMAILLDVVPNHMCIVSAKNRLWWDLLKYGERSAYARYFDIDWHPPAADLDGKVLLPFLGSSLERAIQEGALSLLETENELVLGYGDMHFPIDPATRLSDDLLAVHSQQHYRLDHWLRGISDLNYRRFFDINELAALCLERPEVFEGTHALILRWIEEGLIQGLRIDHVDGLYDPERYFRDLQEHSGGIYLIAEKILQRGESLCSRWEVQGTTGYEFLNELNGLFVDRGKKEALYQGYRRFTGDAYTPEEVVVASKKHLLRSSMAPEIKRLLHLFFKLSDQNPRQLEVALEELIAAFPIYRTYLRPPYVSKSDARILSQAFTQAKERHLALAAPVWASLEHILRTDRQFAMRFQQTTGPVMAKGYEDTALYRFFPLASLNEVGSDLAVYGTTLEAFHRSNAERLQKWPGSLLTTSTHDSKRNEDVRARLNLLSEIPKEWEVRLRRWHRMNREEVHPDPCDEYLLYQTLIGTFPLLPMRRFDHCDYVERICCYMLKALKEAKRRTKQAALIGALVYGTMRLERK